MAASWDHHTDAGAYSLGILVEYGTSIAVGAIIALLTIKFVTTVSSGSWQFGTLTTWAVIGASVAAAYWANSVSISYETIVDLDGYYVEPSALIPIVLCVLFAAAMSSRWTILKNHWQSYLAIGYLSAVEAALFFDLSTAAECVLVATAFIGLTFELRTIGLIAVLFPTVMSVVLAISSSHFACTRFDRGSSPAAQATG